jgi:hypothetical protein
MCHKRPLPLTRSSPGRPLQAQAAEPWAWDAAACERAKRDYCLGHEMLRRDLDLKCGAQLVQLMTPDHRFLQPAPAAVKALSPPHFAAALGAQVGPEWGPN